MVNRYGKPLTPAGIASVEDAEIDFDDIPELDADFWREAEPVAPGRTERIDREPERRARAQRRPR